jgi:urea transport system ATP-binding protein
VSSLLETADLGVRFGGVWALRGLNLQIEEGEIHGFIGPNGSGKSTLFNAITGRCKATTGEVRFKDRNLRKLDSGERARLGITLKFQVTSVFAGLSVLQNVLLGLLGPRPVLGEMRRRRGERADMEKATELLTAVGLWEKRDEIAGNLAHGEKGWLEIGMALATEPTLLLLDEPASGMGADETARTVELIKRIRPGRTIFVIEHDMDFVRSCAETITVLYRGSLLTQGDYDTVKSDERVIDAYLGRGRQHGVSDR